MKYKEKKQIRSSNFELLRIILIFMVIILHYFNGEIGGLLKEVQPNSFNYYLSHLLESFSIIAVNVFIILTGYFSCQKKSIKISKPIKLYALSIFYGVLVSGTIILITKTNMDPIQITNFTKSIFDRWFIVIYCILYLLIPYINKLTTSLKKSQFEKLLLINTIFFYFWYTFFSNTTIMDGGYRIINFINLYMVGSYIKLHNNTDIPKTKSLLVYLICSILTMLYSLITDRAFGYATIFNLISSIALFEFFKSLKIKTNPRINKLATYTFSVYILHENFFFVNVLYRKLFQTSKYWNHNLMILNLIITVIGIYVICVMIEFIRRILFKKILDDKIDKIKYEIDCQ